MKQAVCAKKNPVLRAAGSPASQIDKKSSRWFINCQLPIARSNVVGGGNHPCIGGEEYDPIFGGIFSVFFPAAQSHAEGPI